MKCMKKQIFKIIKKFPISFFSIVVGLMGFVNSFKRIELLLDINTRLFLPILFCNLLIFISIALIYLIKLIKYPNEVKEEFKNPIKLNFFPMFSVSLLLISMSLFEINSNISEIFWIIGTCVHFILTIKIISFWMWSQNFKIEQMNPACFIPAVGNILIPIVGVNYSYELSWFFFSVGFIFWIILITILFNRIFFYERLKEKLLPSLFILLAPPSIGFISILKLTGDLNIFSKILYYFALFLVILLFSQVKHFKIKYCLSWWSYTFPLSAFIIATSTMFLQTNIMFFKYVAVILFFVLVLITSIIFVKTIKSNYKFLEKIFKFN